MVAFLLSWCSGPHAALEKAFRHTLLPRIETLATIILVECVLGLPLTSRTSWFRYPTKDRRPSLPLHPPSGYGIRWVVEVRLGAIPILTSKFGSIGYPLRRRRGIGGLRGGPRRRRGVGGEIPLPSHFRPRTFRSEATAYINNRWEVVIRYGLLALSGRPMITQHWGPKLIAPGHRVPSRDTWDTCPAFV
jgi:hypothetical protein